MYRDLCTKKPWYEVTPTGYKKHDATERKVGTNDMPMPDDEVTVIPKTQADFLREYYPSGHRIMDSEEYPDVWKKDPETGKLYMQPIQRTAFAFQQLIATKHILHMTGNDIQFEIAQGRDTESKEEELQKQLTAFKKVWLMADMEIRGFEAIRSYYITGDCAIVGFIRKDGKFGAKTLSYLNGDTLYPQYDSITGELTAFGRKYYDYADDGSIKVEWLEVWDDTCLYRFAQTAKDGTTDQPYVINDEYVVNGYNLVSKKPHGFNFLPVAYARNDAGPVWAAVQHNIEDYEEAFSHLCENNKAYAFPIFYYKGAGQDLQVSGDMNGAVKALAIDDTNADAGFLKGTDASNAFATQLDKAYSLIYELSFTVKPPELKSGDLPGVALKLLYSPALEAAMNDAELLQPFLTQTVKIVKYGVGYENDNVQTMMALPINAWYKAYTHANYTEEISNLATAVQNKFLSRQTASERCPEFPKNDEYERIQSEIEEQKQQDLLQDIQLQDAQTQNAIEEEEAQARINRGKGGSDISTGRGTKRGRPRTVDTDKWGNRKDGSEENWDRWNATH